MSPFGFVMQEVNTQIKKQQKHFMRNIWIFFANSRYVVGTGLFSQYADGFCFHAKGFSAWAQSSYNCNFFLLVLRDDFYLINFFGPTRGKASPTLATPVLGQMADENTIITELLVFSRNNAIHK